MDAFDFPRIDPRLFGYPAHSLATILTELSRLSHAEEDDSKANYETVVCVCVCVCVEWIQVAQDSMAGLCERRIEDGNFITM